MRTQFKLAVLAGAACVAMGALPAAAVPFDATSPDYGPSSTGSIHQFTINSPGASGSGDATITFDIKGYGAIEGAGVPGEDQFNFTLNGDLVFSGYFNMGGGGVEAIAFLYAPGGAFWFTNSAGPSQGGTTHVEIGQTLIAGDNTFKFNYAGSEGFDDEAWGLENFHVSADIAPAIFPIDDCIETAGVTCDTPGAVPEPVTLGLLSAGLLGMGAMRRRA